MMKREKMGGGCVIIVAFVRNLEVVYCMFLKIIFIDNR